MLVNFSDETLNVPKATLLGIAEELSESLVKKINARSEFNSNMPTKEPRKRINEALYHKLLHGNLDDLTQEERQQTEPIILKCAHVFHDKETNDFKETKVIEHQIVGNANRLGDHSVEPHMPGDTRCGHKCRKCLTKSLFGTVILPGQPRQS